MRSDAAAPPPAMLSFAMPQGLFQMRAVAIIVRDGHVLLHRANDDIYWTLPGGRIEFGESAAETIRREIEEELGCSSEVGPLRLMIENFFVYNNRAVHEIGWYHTVELTGAFPFVTDDICHRATDGTAQLEFRWAPLGAGSPFADQVLPPVLWSQLVGPDTGFRHLVERE